MKLISFIKGKYEKLNQSTQETILFLLNYIFNAIPISLFIYIIMSLSMNHSILRFFSTYLCTTIFLVYFEHYFVWIRSELSKK